VDRRPPNDRLRAVRTDMNLSQDAFAANLGRFMRQELHCNVSPNGNLIGMWERGEVRPGPVYRSGLMAYTGLPEWELGLTPPPGNASTVQQRIQTPDHDDAEATRSVISAGMSLAGLALELRSDVPDTISAEYVEEIGQTIEAYRAHVYRHGASRRVRREAARLLDRCAASIPDAPGHALRISLMRATAEAAGAAAYVCRDLLLHDLAQQHYLLGLQVAQAADDRAMVRHILVRLASHNIEMVRPRDALACLDMARRADVADECGHGELANQLAIEAWASAQAGLTDHAIKAADQADDEATYVEPSDRPTWQVRNLSEAELCSLTGATFAELARREPKFALEAIRRLSKALDLRGDESARNRALDFISLAEAHLAARQVTEAAQAARHAVEQARVGSSQRVRLRLDELRERLRPHLTQADLTARFRPGHQVRRR
jgi:transcriptional regulator with XRE-family HTH domain